MSKTTLEDLDSLFRCFAEAHDALQRAEESFSITQRHYATIGQAYMKAGPYRADHGAIESARAMQELARQERASCRVAAVDAQSRATAALAHLGASDCGGLEDLLALRRVALAARRLGAVSALLGVALFAAVLLAAWFALTQPVRQTWIAVGATFFLFLLHRLVKGARGTATRTLVSGMLEYVRATRPAVVGHAAEDQQPRETVAAAPGSGAPAAAVVRTPEFQAFQDKYAESLRLKDRAALASALRLRQEATQAVRRIPALFSAGKHHEMILEYNHIGRGMDARASALEALRHESDLEAISRELQPSLKFNCYQETLEYMVLASTSYDEVFDYAGRLKRAFPADSNARRLQEFQDLRKKHGRWYSTHRAILASLYSRVSPEQDKGRHAAGVAVIDVILANAENAGYNLDYEEYFDLLDDMCALALQVMMATAPHRPRGSSADEDGRELCCLLEKPIEHLSKSYADCPAKDKHLFDGYCNAFARFPGIGLVPAWQELRGVTH